MSAIEERGDAATPFESLPEFDLDCLVDDPDDPSEITVFPDDGDDITTTWLSIDVDHAVPLEEVA